MQTTPSNAQAHTALASRSTWVFAAVCWVGFLASGCSVDPSIAADTADAKSAKRVLLCQQGLSDRTVGWDKGLFDLCESAEQTGFTLVRDGDFPAFGALDEDGAYDALFDALDTNDDGQVGKDDAKSAVHLVGFSWGGINVTDLAERLWEDDRIETNRRGVAAMVLLDPFQPQVSRALVPANVHRTWVYRQTETTDGDCSVTPSLGFGFNGHRPLAESERNACTTYDLDAFMDDIGHCDVPKAASQAALLNITQRRSYPQWSAHGSSCDTD